MTKYSVYCIGLFFLLISFHSRAMDHKPQMLMMDTSELPITNTDSIPDMIPVIDEKGDTITSFGNEPVKEDSLVEKKDPFYMYETPEEREERLFRKKKVYIAHRARKLMTDYFRNGDFCEKSICEVNKESIDKVLKLFYSNATIIDDLFPGKERVNVKDYTMGVYNYLEKRGVQYSYKVPSNDDYKYEGPDIGDIIKAEDDYGNVEYYCTCYFIKVMYIQLDNKGNVIELQAKGQEVEIPLRMKIWIDGDLERAKIVSISTLDKR